MWTLIKDNAISEIINSPQDIRIDGALHSSQIFTQWSDIERAEIGLIPVEDEGQEKDEKFYTNSFNVIYADGKSVRRITNVPKDLNAVKLQLKKEVNQSLRRFLLATDWVIVRKTETGKDAPSDLSTWRAALRAKAGELESAIAAASNIAELEAVNISWPPDPRAA